MVNYSAAVDYISTYFEHPTLAKIHGEPTYNTLRKMKNELMRNAASVPSDLGGGANGHLGLLLTPAEYLAVHTTAYTRPVHPGALNIPAGTTQHESTRLKDEHRQQVQEFRETVNVEKAMIKQIVHAIDAKFLDTLRNRTTDSIDQPIVTILEYLFTKYGNIDDDALAHKEKLVREMQYNVQDPLITIYKEVEDLEDLGKASSNPYLPSQLVTFALQIIKNTGDFEDSQKKWHTKLTTDKTWSNFKIHFDAEHQALRKVRGITMRSTAFHNAAMSTEIIEELRSVKETVNVALMTRTIEQDDRENIPPSNHANYASSNDDQSEVLSFLKKLQEEVAALKISNERNSNNNNRKRKRTDKYCWTHGACAHESKDCKASYRKEGHIESATFTNKQSGSLRYCTPVNP